MPARRRVVRSLAVGGSGGAVSAPLLRWQLTALLAWDVTALTFVCRIWATLWKLDARQISRHAGRGDPTRAGADLLLLSASTASLVAVWYVIVNAGRSGPKIGFGTSIVALTFNLVAGLTA